MCSDKLVGVYILAAVAVTRRRLTLNNDGTWLLDDWRDLGGRWIRVNKGRYVVEPGGLRLQPEGKSGKDLELFSALLHIEIVMSEVVLVPEANLSKFKCDISDSDATDRLFYLDAGWNVYRKQPLPRIVICRDVRCFEDNLTLRQRYVVREETQEHLRVATDTNRLRWFPRECFIEPNC